MLAKTVCYMSKIEYFLFIRFENGRQLTLSFLLVNKIVK